MNPSGVVAELEKAAAALGNDPFALHGKIAATGEALPPEFGASVAALLVGSGNPVLAQAAVGFALSPDPDMAAAALRALEPPPGGKVEQITLDRLERIRPWLGESRQVHVDAALRALRPRAAPPSPPAKSDVRRIVATAVDGSGGQSLFALVRQGKTFALVSLLLRSSGGVIDTLVIGGLRKDRADAMLGHIVRQTGALTVSRGLAERRICDALTVNLAQDAPPPFGMLQVVETLGLGVLHPLELPPLALVEPLLEGVPADRTDDAASRAARRGSAAWTWDFPMLDSWFEAGPEADAVMRRHRSKKQRVASLLADHLPKRRTFWAACCAWTAAVLKDQRKPNPDVWIPFALVARDLAGTTPLGEIALMTRIADVSADEYRQSR